MEIKTFTEKEMSLLSRKRIKFELDSSGPTPSKNSLKEQIAKKWGIKPELIAIRHVYTKYGSQKAKVIAHLYEDEKTLKFLEPPKGKKVEPKKAG